MTETAKDKPDKPAAPIEGTHRGEDSLPPARLQFFAIVLFACGVNVLLLFLFPSSAVAASPLVRALVETIAVAVLAVPPAYYLAMRPLYRFLRELQRADKALRTSETHYRIASELTTTFVFDLAVDRDGKMSLVSVSGNYHSFAGQDPAAASFDSLFDHIHPDDKPALAGAIGRLVATPQSVELECRAFVGNPHELRWISVFGKSEADASRQGVTTICGAVKDITRSKAAERAAAESSQRLQRLADSFQGFIAYVRADTLKYEFVNETYARQFGLPRDRIVGSKVKDIVGEEAFAFALRFIDKVRAGQSCSYENAFDLVSGTRWIEVNYFPVFDADGRVESIAVLNYDITERKRAEKEQQRVRNLLEVSQRLAHIGSWEYEISTRKLSWSDEMYRIAGLPMGSTVNREMVESFFPQEELGRSRQNLSSVLQNESPYSSDYRVQRKDGQWIVIHSEGELIHDQEGRPLRILGTTQDITARKKAEEELRRSHQIIEAMLNAIPAGVFWKDTDSVFLGCNRIFAKDAGFEDPGQIIGRNDYEIGCPRDKADYYRSEDRRVIENGETVLNVEHLSSMDKAPVDHLATKVPLRDDAGKIGGVLGTYVDITQLKLAEEALRESEEKFRSIIEQSADGIVVTRQDGSIVEWNHSQESLTGLTEESVLGKSIWEVQSVFIPEDRRTEALLERMQAETESFLRGEKGRFIERRERTISLADGTVKIVSESAFLVRQAASNIGVMVLNDITDRKNAENDKLLAEQYLQRAQRLESLGVLAGGIAHDFNNILTTIYGYMELARDQTRNESAAEYLTQATASMDRAKGLAQQLLTFSKGGTPIKKVTRIASLVRETSLFATGGSNVKCVLSIAPDLWSCSVDRSQIGRVIHNLVINAAQAMPMGGSIEVSGSNAVLHEGEHPTLKPGKYVVISIKDQGTGISQDILPKIFDPFFTTKTQGHGLGLAISHSVVLRHEGAINVQSEPGTGTTFQVYLPASDEPGAGDEEPRVRTHSGSGRILVMDDEEGVRNLLSTALQSAGYTVVCRENGQDTIEVFVREKEEEKSFAAVILDLIVPGGIGGKEVAEAIRKVDRDVPLFVASGYAADEIVAHPEDYGFSASISKPFRIGDLMEMLRKHLKRES